MRNLHKTQFKVKKSKKTPSVVKNFIFKAKTALSDNTVYLTNKTSVKDFYWSIEISKRDYDIILSNAEYMSFLNSPNKTSKKSENIRKVLEGCSGKIYKAKTLFKLEEGLDKESFHIKFLICNLLGEPYKDTYKKDLYRFLQTKKFNSSRDSYSFGKTALFYFLNNNTSELDIKLAKLCIDKFITVKSGSYLRICNLFKLSNPTIDSICMNHQMVDFRLYLSHRPVTRFSPDLEVKILKGNLYFREYYLEYLNGTFSF